MDLGRIIGLIYVLVGALTIMFWFPYMGVYRAKNWDEDTMWYVRMLWFMFFWFIGGFVLEAIIG